MSSPEPHPSSSTLEGTVQNAEEAAAQALESGEVCVSEHPVSSISTAFIGGMVMGALIGWGIAQARHHTYREACRDFARDWLQRLHLD